ncbi:MAG: hypothetical protein CMP76_08080 [Flavobacterium sp.]|uniref:hypothetical protein n=1 Tax=Flavobacterium sp. TaxID=239 RepID=UPI000C4081C7|nr:hypothetical protein [Flavobacterium sp.]MBF03239.1 hypothetical protein [Flavobacterium sp.]|tara:strand:+ start:4839 stop:5504 length:666 start_codon:yes stop_codon:yes gene_type:complete
MAYKTKGRRQSSNVVDLRKTTKKKSTVSKAGTKAKNAKKAAAKKGLNAPINTNKKFYTNIEVIKLKEYRMSYGSKETLKYDSAIETEKHLEVYKDGFLDRKILKTAKYFISFKGKSVTEASFRRKNLSAKKAWEVRKKKIEEDYKKRENETFKAIENTNLEFEKLKNKIQKYVNDKKIAKITHQGSKQLAFKVQRMFKGSVNNVSLARLIRDNIKEYRDKK